MEVIYYLTLHDQEFNLYLPCIIMKQIWEKTSHILENVYIHASLSPEVASAKPIKSPGLTINNSWMVAAHVRQRTEARW